MAQQPGDTVAGPQRGGLLGSLKDALNAAGRADQGQVSARSEVHAPRETIALPPPLPHSEPALAAAPAGGEPATSRTRGVSAHEAARAARGEPVEASGVPEVEPEQPPTTRVVKGAALAAQGSALLHAATPAAGAAPAKTQLVRGKQPVQRGAFAQDPVVGWLVVVGGPGIGSYRPIFEGNNTVGRSPSQRIALDFGDDAISNEEQAYIRYDSTDRSFLFVPNLAKTNVVSVNDRRPTGAVELRQMDVIVIGRTQLVFVPFCGADFDWSELADAKV